MLKPMTLRGQLPRGVQDWFLADAAQRAALDARGAARLAGFDEPQQEAAAQQAYAAIAGAPDSW